MPRSSRITKSTPADVDADVGDVEDRPVGQREEVDDVPAEGPGSTEDAVDQVAGHAGQQQAERQRPAAVPHAAGVVDHDHDAATIATTEITGVSEVPVLNAAPGLRSSRSWRKRADQLDRVAVRPARAPR